MILISQEGDGGLFLGYWNKINNYFSDLDPDTVFSVLVSVGIFSLGWFLTVLYESHKERSRLKERARFLKGSIETILSSIERQQQEYTDLSKEMLDLKQRFFHLNIATYLNFKFYSPHLIEDIHRFLEKHQEGSFQVIKSLNGTINGVEVQVNHSKENVSKFTANAKELEREWVNILDKVFRYFDNIADDIRNGLKPDDFQSEFGTIMHNWATNRNDADTKYTYVSLVVPLLELCEKSMPHSDAKAILPWVSEARYTYENIVTNRRRYSDLFANDSDQIKKYGKTLSILVDVIDENLKLHRVVSKHFKKDISSFEKLLLNESKNKKSEDDL